MMAIGFQVARDQNVIRVVGGISNNRPHKHHAMQVTWAPPGKAVRLDLRDVSIEGACLAVDGGVTHSLVAAHGLIALIDSASALAYRIRSQFFRDSTFTVITSSMWSGAFRDSGPLVANLAKPDAAAPMDPRIRDVLEWLDAMERASTWAEVALEGALSCARLSESRFLHLFTQQVGSPWRTYLVWRRALVAITLATGGASLTEAAHAAGYSDSAHLSRQFVLLFGVTPAAFAKNSRFIQS